ncbi:MAG TPA: ABC transporter permease subunit [Planctomycetota bacterium]|nr:ABC transporter permease subunit [Planctomycetota bacterium]
MDRLAGGVVTLGGITIIGSILAILFVIVMEMLPLFGSATVTPLATASLEQGSAPLGTGSDELQEVAWVAGAQGLRFHSMADWSALSPAPELKLEGASVTSVTPLTQALLAFGLSNGKVIPAQLSFVQSFAEGRRKVEPRFKAETPFVLDPAGKAVQHLVRATSESGALLVGSTLPNALALLRLKQKKTLMGEGKIQELRSTLPLSVDATVTALAVDTRGDELFVGLSDGQLVRVDLRDPDVPKPAVPLLAAEKSGTAITALGFLNGDRTLVVGDAAGDVSTWQTLRSEEGAYYLTRMNRFEPHHAAVVRLSPSIRDKGFISADTQGGIHLNYATTGSTLATVTTGGEAAAAAALTPKADGILAVASSGKVYRWNVKNPHPETTLRSLFGQVWYEGYSRPEAVWQSTGGTDDFEPKFGLGPLIYGTLKGTFYALIIAVPLALLSALYVSQFMHPRLKQNIKPLIEIMAALPSVVLGFIAALWLAPNIERRIPGIFLLPIVESVLILAAVAIWRMVPLGFRQRFQHGSEVALILPVVLIGAALSFWLGGALESSALGGDYQAWLLRVLGLSYDQRNSVVVGLAMGFAVIPIIFTIAEDSLTNVPPYLAAGSLALGATRWQTALKVVLPSASPGIFSAVMIGFGRAVGETMIVLMATGNTPVMNWNPFRGFRALSANVAVELPEAPEGGTLFRVLFLAAFLLFLMTFTVNTLAEMIRLRLRKRFQSL